MCGISGIMDFAHQGIRRNDIQAMMDTMAHRGPDDSGWLFVDIPHNKFYHDKTSKLVFEPANIQLAFGHNRLSIIDLTEAGHQPMCNESQTIWLTYNGEIYNYRELAAELKNLGHSFKSKTDSEVIIHAYEQWGVDCLPKFNGMWAFGLWDQTRKLLFMARDRFGIKPFYYFYADNKLIFSSEIKAFMPLVKLEPNYHYIYNYLSTGQEDGFEDTFFKAIKQLLPGYYMRIEYSKNELQTIKYWDFQINLQKSEAPGKQIEDEFRYLLEDSVKLRLRSDVPVGTCLSGGLDSSSIFLFASRNYINGNMHAFTSYFAEGADYDERKHAELVINEYNGIGHKVYPKGEKLLERLEQIIWHIENPTDSTGVYPQWHVLDLAKDHVKVVLDGQGGDELLAGYPHYYNYYVADFINQLCTKGGLSKTGGLSQVIGVLRFLDKTRFKNIIADELLPEFIVKFKKKIWTNEILLTFLSPEFCNRFRGEKTYQPEIVKSKLYTKLLYDLKRDMIPKFLKYEDRISMAFSMESRVPFMDHRLVEFVFSLPDSFRIRDGWTKSILRRSLDGMLPKAITWRKDKKGFPTPIDIWFRHSLKNCLMDILSSSRFRQRGIFDTKVVDRLMKEYFQGKRNGMEWDIWRWVSLEIWFRKFGL